MTDQEAAAFKPLDREAAEAHDRHFAATDFIRLPGAKMPISRTLAYQMGYEVSRALPWTPGGDPEEGPAGDVDQVDSDIFAGA